MVAEAHENGLFPCPLNLCSWKPVCSLTNTSALQNTYFCATCTCFQVRFVSRSKSLKAASRNHLSSTLVSEHIKTEFYPRRLVRPLQDHMAAGVHVNSFDMELNFF